jgi:hypothetical protein
MLEYAIEVGRGETYLTRRLGDTASLDGPELATRRPVVY